jgi:hypothetical protein
VSGFFVVFALIGTAFFLSLLFHNPARQHIAAYLPDPFKIRFLLWSSYSPLWLIMLGVLPVLIAFLLIFVAASAIHPAHSFSATVGDIINSSAFAHAVYGFTFGLLLSLWVYRFYYLDYKNDDIDWKMKAQGVLLLFLFIAGSQEWFGELLDRVAKLSFGGAAIELQPPEQSKNSDQSPRLVTNSQAASEVSGSEPTYPAVGLTILQQIDGIIIRDSAVLREEGVPHVNDYAGRFFKRYFGDVASCYKAMYDATGDSVLITRQYEKLIPEFHQAVLATELGARVDPKFYDAYLELAKKIFDEYTDISLLAQQAPPGSVHERDINLVQNGCGSFFEAYASANISEIESLNKNTILDETAKAFRSRFETEFEWGLGRTMREYPNPYLRLVLSSVEDLASDPEAALKELDDELIVLEAPGGKPAEWISLGSSEKVSATDLFKARVYSTMYLIAEEWIRRSVFVPSMLRDFNTSMVKNTVLKFGTIPIYREGWDRFQAKERNIDSEFSEVPANHSECGKLAEQYSLPWIRAYSGYTYVTFIAELVDKMTDSEEYLQSYSGEVRRYIDELNHVDLSCLSVILPKADDVNKFSAKVYADILRANAKVISADAKAIQPLADANHNLESTKLALKATNLGLEVLQPFYEAEKKQREYKTEKSEDLREYTTEKGRRQYNKTFLETIEGTDVIETHDRLSSLNSTLEEVVKSSQR